MLKPSETIEDDVIRDIGLQAVNRNKYCAHSAFTIVKKKQKAIAILMAAKNIKKQQRKFSLNCDTNYDESNYFDLVYFTNTMNVLPAFI